jgi:hypothetical protein
MGSCEGLQLLLELGGGWGAEGGLEDARGGPSLCRPPWKNVARIGGINSTLAQFVAGGLSQCPLAHLCLQTKAPGKSPPRRS